MSGMKTPYTVGRDYRREAQTIRDNVQYRADQVLKARECG